LLRSPTSPDPDADLGIHEFTYSLLPHNGNLIESDVIREARQLNNPALLIDACEHKDFKLPVVVAGKGVALEVLKKAEKEECWVMRLVENYGCETVAKIKLNDTKMSLVECDLLEWNEAKNLGKGSLEFKMSPFEIRTFKIKLA